MNIEKTVAIVAGGGWVVWASYDLRTCGSGYPEHV
jgi:hypothetical protein